MGTRAGLHDYRAPCYFCDCEVQQLRCEFGTEVSSQFLNCVPKGSETVVGTRAGLHRCSFTPAPQLFTVMLYKQ